MLLRRDDLVHMLTAFAVLIATHLKQPSDPTTFQELATDTVSACLMSIAQKEETSTTSEMDRQAPAAPSPAAASSPETAVPTPARHSEAAALAPPPPTPGLTPATAAIEREKQALGLATPAPHVPVLPCPTRLNSRPLQRKSVTPQPTASQTGARRKVTAKSTTTTRQPWR